MILLVVMGLAGGERPGLWEPREHRALADSALQIVLGELADDAPLIPGESGSRLTRETIVWNDRTFGRLAEALAQNDGAASRFQRAGRTVFEQLAEVTEYDLREFWERVSTRGASAGRTGLGEPAGKTAVANYLLAHVAALNFARDAGSAGSSSRSPLLLMLAYESMAQGFLADAHSSGHLLVPRHDAFQALHPINNGRAHIHYNSEGVFVVNGRHQVWQAFGDGVLTWYPTSYRQVLEASVTSLREVFLVYYVSVGSVPGALERWTRMLTNRSASGVVNDWLSWKHGDAYYASLDAMPALSYIPMPVSATWSVRSQATDRHGVRIRNHYPQLREPGYHDPDLPASLCSHLYSRSSLPARFIPDDLGPAHELALAADTHRDVSSVEFHQIHKLRASYSGLVTALAVGMYASEDRTTGAVSAGVGWGIAQNILVATHVSINTEITFPIEGGSLSRVTAALGLNPAGLPFRAEIGYATAMDDFLNDSGVMLSAGYDLTSQVLGLTYMGAVVRLRYVVMMLDDMLHAPSVQVAFY